MRCGEKERRWRALLNELAVFDVAPGDEWRAALKQAKRTKGGGMGGRGQEGEEEARTWRVGQRG
eukprot:5925524-Pleurochrysis_carterae.AAC.1